MAVELKDTLNLPQTGFPMRAGLVAREPARADHWQRLGLYERIQQQRAAAPVFVLHDGPPFTNSDAHIGTALNKVLKDITLRYRTLRGHRTPYVPGWDCHGLPIEQRVAREFQEEGRAPTAAELRDRCDAFAETWIARQTAQFRRLGILGDWEHPYRTKDPSFEAEIVRTFASFVEQGLVYRSKKPVYWSIPFETALAEAEVEYRDHVSPSVWVRFTVPAAAAEARGLPGADLAAVIWTTTPWTLPANLAIAVHPELDYAVVRAGGRRHLVAAALAARFASETGLGEFEVESVHRGATLEGLETRHPFIDRASPVVLADYVTTDAGTGCVHTAPGHGHEDYLTGLKYGLEIYCPVGADGRYVADGRVPDDLVGLTTLESAEDLAKKRTSPANIAVLRKLEAGGALVAHRRHEHSYPHCWRSKTPIIFRAVDQWFVSLDRDGLRQRALDAIGGVQWVPAWGEQRIRGAVETRPDWCISRQRAWGVPIPAFFDGEGRAWLDAGVARAIADRIERDGSNVWFRTPAAELLAGIPLPADWPPVAELRCGGDTLDVWIDSGSSHLAVLRRGHGGTQWPADLYLEGSDQHRGWFQSSLWTGMIAAGGPPYRAVLTHGFIVDQERNKISKSSTYQKPQTSEAYVSRHGADVIRLWIASQDFRDDIPVSEEILGHVGEAYRTLRNTLRYQLSNLYDFAAARDEVPWERLDPLDRWALHQTARLVDQCRDAYDTYEFHRVYQLCNQFCAVTLSATYHDILKDRLYTLAPAHPLRRSAQTAIHHIFGALARVLSPLLVFTADEAWSHRVAGADFADTSVHLESWPELPEAWRDPEVAAATGRVLALRARVNEAIEALRQGGAVGKSLDAILTVRGDPGDADMAALMARRDGLAELFMVSEVRLETAPGRDLALQVAPAAGSGYVRCPRCWRWVPVLVSTAHGETCPRCAEALSACHR